MENFEPPTPEYIKRFNQGYILAQEMPDLADQLAKNESGSLQQSGLKQGIEQFKSEKDKSNYPSWLKPDRLSNLNKASGLTKDDVELDK